MVTILVIGPASVIENCILMFTIMFLPFASTLIAESIAGICWVASCVGSVGPWVGTGGCWCKRVTFGGVGLVVSVRCSSKVTLTVESLSSSLILAFVV